MLDYVRLLYPTVLDMALKNLVFVFNKVNFIINRDLSKQF